MGQSSSKCPVPDDADDYNNQGSAYDPMLYTAGACTAVTFLISVSLIVTHLRRYRCPKEQRQIIRISFTPFVFALVSFFEVLSYDVAPYIDPLVDWYESFGLCALFLLYIQYAAPGGTFDENTFNAVKAAEEGNMTDFDWPRITWVFVFQYPLTELLSMIILEATEGAGVYCVQSLSPKYGHLWVQVISSVGVGAAVLAIIRFYGRMKARMRVRRGLAKLLCFKLIVGLRFFQSFVFSILLDHNTIKPSKTFSYHGIQYGLENALTCAEMVLCSLLFWFSYSSTEYATRAKPQDRRTPVAKAILDAINPWDLLAGLGRLFTIVLHLQRTGGFQQWSVARQRAKAEKKDGRLRRQRGQGRYQTTDGQESLSRPGAAYGMDGISYPADMTGQLSYQAPSSPPLRYDRSPSPADSYIPGRVVV